MSGIELAAWSFPILLLLIFVRVPIGLAMLVCGLVGAWLIYGTADPILNQMKQRVLQPLARSISAQVNFECAWKTLQDRAAQKRIANHKAANETRDFTTAAGLHRGEVASFQLRDHRL